jgi:hypothetical protein
VRLRQTFLVDPVQAKERISSVVPAAPTHLTVVPKSSSHFKLSWVDHSSTEDGFLIDRRIAGASEWMVVLKLPANTTSCESYGAFANTKYQHRVRAYQAGVGSSASDAVEATSLKTIPTRSKIIFEGKIASSFLQPGNEILNFYTERSGGDKSDSSVNLMYSVNGGDSWVDLGTLFDGRKDHVTKHPSVIKLSNGKIALAYILEKEGTWRADQVIRYFPKPGAGNPLPTAENLIQPGNWTPAETINDNHWSYHASIHDRFVLMSDGSLIIPMMAGNVRRKNDPKGSVVYKLDAKHIDEAKDDPTGRWKRTTPDWIHTGKGFSGKGGRSGFVELCLVEWRPGHLLLYGRTDKGWFYESRSSDYGETWSAPVESKVRCAIMTPILKKIPGSNDIALLWTSILKSKTEVNDPSKRLCLASMISKDGGMTWENYRQIEYDGINYHSYPWMLFDGDTLHLAHQRQGAVNVRGLLSDMYYTRLPSSWFTEKD